jgi:hypothetical protein
MLLAEIRLKVLLSLLLLSQRPDWYQSGKQAYLILAGRILGGHCDLSLNHP